MEQGKVERGEGAVQYGPLKYSERARINPSSPRVKQGQPPIRTIHVTFQKWLEKCANTHKKKTTNIEGIDMFVSLMSLFHIIHVPNYCKLSHNDIQLLPLIFQ